MKASARGHLSLWALLVNLGHQSREGGRQDAHPLDKASPPRPGKPQPQGPAAHTRPITPARHRSLEPCSQIYTGLPKQGSSQPRLGEYSESDRYTSPNIQKGRVEWRNPKQGRSQTFPPPHSLCRWGCEIKIELFGTGASPLPDLLSSAAQPPRTLHVT